MQLSISVDVDTLEDYARFYRIRGLYSNSAFYHRVIPSFLKLFDGLSIKATFFIASQLVGQEGYLTWNYLHEIWDGGMDIQSHGVSHNPLGKLVPSEIEKEISQSKEIIERNIGNNVSLMSLPHGSKSDNLDEVTSQHIRRVLKKTNGKIHGAGGAAELLGINASTLRNRMNKLGIEYKK